MMFYFTLMFFYCYGNEVFFPSKKQRKKIIFASFENSKKKFGTRNLTGVYHDKRWVRLFFLLWRNILLPIVELLRWEERTWWRVENETSCSKVNVINPLVLFNPLILMASLRQMGTQVAHFKFLTYSCLLSHILYKFSL